MMQLPLQITFRHMEPSAAMEANIREKASKLDRFFEHIMSCRVVVEAPDKHKHKGGIYHVSIDITVPDSEIVVSRKPDQNHAHEDAYVAIRDAFDAAKRQLEDYVRRRKQHVKTHEVTPHGVVAELVPGEDYGRIETAEGRSIYFHRNSLVNADLDKLTVGDEVRFNEVSGDEGPQASSVIVEGKHHVAG